MILAEILRKSVLLSLSSALPARKIGTAFVLESLSDKCLLLHEELFFSTRWPSLKVYLDSFLCKIEGLMTFQQ
jgi:hypothetical protein